MENFGIGNLPDQAIGSLQGLFPNISIEDSIINSYTECFLPSEPVLEDSITHTFYITRKPTNTWTGLNQIRSGVVKKSNV